MSPSRMSPIRRGPCPAITVYKKTLYSSMSPYAARAHEDSRARSKTRFEPILGPLNGLSEVVAQPLNLKDCVKLPQKLLRCVNDLRAVSVLAARM